MEHCNPNTHAGAGGRLRRERMDDSMQYGHFRSWICSTQAAAKGQLNTSSVKQWKALNPRAAVLM